MKNYKVEVISNFNDLEEKKDRVVGDVFKCTKERYDYLNGGNEKGKVVVKLIEAPEEPRTRENEETEEREYSRRSRRENRD